MVRRLVCVMAMLRNDREFEIRRPRSLAGFFQHAEIALRRRKVLPGQPGISRLIRAAARLVSVST